MSQAIKDYVKFNVLGIEEDLVSEEDKKKIKSLQAKKHILQRNTNKNYTIETYSLEKQIEIFNSLKLRQGQKCRITFMNDQNMPVEILGAELKDRKILLCCVFCKTRRTFKMWLSTFLKDLSFGAIKLEKIRPEGFKKYYLSTVSDALKETLAELKELQEKYNKIYEEQRSSLKANYDNELAKYGKVEKEAKAKRYQMSSTEALAKAKTYKGVERVKNYWNSKITEEEKATLMKWISENIYSIRVYGLLDGQSGNTLSNEYADVGNVRYRPIERNEEGKVTSQDSIVAHISFKTLENAPVDIFKKIISTKGKKVELFYNNRLNDKNLALFLLSEYHDKGFKAGVRNLYKQIV